VGGVDTVPVLHLPPEEELGRATAEGRIEEFARLGWDRDAVPDPQDPATFERSKLDWSELESRRGRRMLAFYRHLARCAVSCRS
jgi:maltooligosyltrehalose trehalohydrolase